MSKSTYSDLTLRAFVPCSGSRLGRPHLRASLRPAFSLIEMMIAIVILGLGLVMTATMFPVAWTRARTLTEYTTQRVVAQSAAATITETLRPSGSSFTAYVNAGVQTGKYFISGGSLAGDVFYDPVLHADPDPSLRLPCSPPNQCYTHLSVLIPSDTRVHALHMGNLHADNTPASDKPYAIERMIELCNVTASPMVCRTNYPIADPHMACNGPLDAGAQFCARSFYAPRVSVGTRLYPPMDDPPASDAAGFNTWLEKFGTRRYSWAALHRLPKPVGPLNVPPPPDALGFAESRRLASEAASAAGTTRVFDFYIVTLKRAQTTSRYAVQDPLNSPIAVTDSLQVANPTARPLGEDVALPVAWRVQVEFPTQVKLGAGPVVTPTDTTDDPTGVATEIQVPPSAVAAGARPMLLGMFPAGTQFVDEISGQVYRVVRRRLNAVGDFAFLTLDREVVLEDLDNSPAMGGNGQIDPLDSVRTVWVYPPPVVERGANDMPVFDDTSPVVGIDIRSISMTPPG